jgi:predicted RNase H-like HicB family nuclease
MNSLFFVALVTGDQASGYHAAIPDLGSLAVHGADLGELLADARRIALEHLQALADAGETWPAPSPLEAMTVPRGAWAVLVEVPVDDRPIRVNVSLGERLVQRLDAAAETRGMTRSGFIAQAVRMSLGEQPRGAAEFDAFGRRIQDELSALGRRINDSIGPESPFGRRMSEFDDRVLDGVRWAADNVSAAVSRRRASRPDEPGPGAGGASPGRS